MMIYFPAKRIQLMGLLEPTRLSRIELELRRRAVFAHLLASAHAFNCEPFHIGWY